jgi:tight adherence protein B
MQIVASIRSYITTPEALCSLCCAGSFLVIVVASVFTASLALGLLVAAGVVLALNFMVSQTLEKRRESLREAIPDALRSMSVCSHAGFSLLQTFQQVAKEVDEPLRSLFLTAVHDLETGLTVSEALSTLKKNADVTELAFIAVALDVQHRAGGSLRQVLEAACDAVESELTLKRSLRVQTAQAKLSARIVSVMPFLLIALFSFISPGFLAPFFASFLGFSLLGVATWMQMAGIFLVRRLLSAGVD